MSGTEGPLGGFASQFAGPAEKLRQEIERMVERVRDQGDKALDVVGLSGLTGWSPPVDIIETPEEIVVLMDVPGLSGDSLNVEIAGNMLTLSGSRPKAEPASGTIVHAVQRPAGEFVRSVPMPIPVNHEQISADISEGVLTVRLSRAEHAKTRQVPVTSRSTSADSN